MPGEVPVGEKELYQVARAGQPEGSAMELGFKAVEDLAGSSRELGRLGWEKRRLLAEISVFNPTDGVANSAVKLLEIIGGFADRTASAMKSRAAKRLDKAMYHRSKGEEIDKGRVSRQVEENKSDVLKQIAEERGLGHRVIGSKDKKVGLRERSKRAFEALEFLYRKLRYKANIEVARKKLDASERWGRRAEYVRKFAEIMSKGEGEAVSLANTELNSRRVDNENRLSEAEERARVAEQRLTEFGSVVRRSQVAREDVMGSAEKKTQKRIVSEATRGMVETMTGAGQQGTK